jgi:alkyl hydroperoxide reductase subunit AhpF
MAKTVKNIPVKKKVAPHCPFCSAEMEALNLPVCQSCHTEVQYCPHCGLPLKKNEKVCTSCGGGKHDAISER